jgi:large subunit ribosomal protein L22
MSTAKLSHVRIAPRKLRTLAKMLRGMPVTRAINSLRFMNKSGSRELFKLLVSAVANAEDKGEVDVDKLVIKTMLVDQGPTLKRWRPRAMGRANRINKKTSHVIVTLAESAPAEA